MLSIGCQSAVKYFLDYLFIELISDGGDDEEDDEDEGKPVWKEREYPENHPLGKIGSPVYNNILPDIAHLPIHGNQAHYFYTLQSTQHCTQLFIVHCQKKML